MPGGFRRVKIAIDAASLGKTGHRRAINWASDGAKPVTVASKRAPDGESPAPEGLKVAPEGLKVASEAKMA